MQNAINIIQETWDLEINNSLLVRLAYDELPESIVSIVLDKINNDDQLFERFNEILSVKRRENFPSSEQHLTTIDWISGSFTRFVKTKSTEFKKNNIYKPRANG